MFSWRLLSSCLLASISKRTIEINTSIIIFIVLFYYNIELFGIFLNVRIFQYPVFHSINATTVKIRSIFFCIRKSKCDLCVSRAYVCLPLRYTRLKNTFRDCTTSPFSTFSLLFCFRRHYDYILLFSACQSGPIHAIGIDLWIILTHVSFCARNNLNFLSRRVRKSIWQSYTRSLHYYNADAGGRALSDLYYKSLNPEFESSVGI